MAQLWSTERIDEESMICWGSHLCETMQDALIRMRDEYEPLIDNQRSLIAGMSATIDALSEQLAELESAYVGAVEIGAEIMRQRDNANARIAALHEEITMLYRDRN